MLKDNITLNIKCGSGGSGAIDFKDRHEKSKPSGGNGGDGGSIYLEVSSLVHDFSHIDSSRQIRTDKGGDGGRNYKDGENTQNVIIDVPSGTRVLDENNYLIADLISDGKTFPIGKGGKGGRGNSSLKSKNNYSPLFAESGEKKQSQKYILDLALINDLAIVGLPNVGKSSLLRSVTNSKASIANYPFTTKSPNIGIITGTKENLTAVDLPGLIGEASKGRGLGKKILKHLIGSKIVVYVLDPSPIQELTIDQQIKMLNTEINNYAKSIEAIPKILLVNKIDLFPDQNFGEYLHISCRNGLGINKLYEEIDNIISNNNSNEDNNRLDYELIKPKFDSHSIERVSDGWKISGSTVNRICNLVGSRDSVNSEIMRRFDESGIEDDLRDLGVKNGDTIYLGRNDFVFND